MRLELCFKVASALINRVCSSSPGAAIETLKAARADRAITTSRLQKLLYRISFAKFELK